jgi:serine/threonine-protein kinase
MPAGTVRVEVFNANQGFAKEQFFELAEGDNGVKRVVVGQGKLEFRVRPYATVLLDGKWMGETPFPPVSTYEGRHSIKLVNRELDREVNVEYVVKAGETNIFKYNLAD